MTKQLLPILIAIPFLVGIRCGGLGGGGGGSAVKADRQLTTTDAIYSFGTLKSHGSKSVTGDAVYWRGDPRTRLEVYANDFAYEREVLDESIGHFMPGELSSHVSGRSDFENEFYSITGSDGYNTVPLDPDFFLTGGIEQASIYYEGLCNILIPWYTEDLDVSSQVLHDAIAEGLIGGLRDVVVTGLDDGLAGAAGTHLQHNVKWFLDGALNLYPNPEERPTKLFHVPGVNNGRPDNQMCLATSFMANSNVRWTPDTAGNKVFVISTFGIITGLAKLFGVGDCRDHVPGKITICGNFDVVSALEADGPSGIWDPDGTFDPNTSGYTRPDEGDVTFRIRNVDAKMADWEGLHPICNNNKHLIEDGLEDVVLATAGASIGQLAGAFSSALPFAFEDCFTTGEGLLCTIAHDGSDPDYAIADGLGLCGHKRAPTSRILFRDGMYP